MRTVERARRTAGAPKPVSAAGSAAQPMAAPARKADSAHSNAQFEDCVEIIADLLDAYGEARTSEVARRFGITASAVVKRIGRLKRAGLATSRPYRDIVLTEEGRKLADGVRARRRLVVKLLVAVGVPAEAAEADAEGMEHHASDATLAAFARFLDDRGAT